MTEEIMSIRNEVDDLRVSATHIERMLDAIGNDGNSLMAKVAWLERDNKKLRELVRRCVEYASQDRCEGCMAKPRCNDGEVDECWQLKEIRVLARKLGIEIG